ncbi:hypothetical protein [Marinobacter alexandrii]|nr:hypothetical protein [Marinobacter alexandrii]
MLNSPAWKEVAYRVGLVGEEKLLAEAENLKKQLWPVSQEMNQK